MKKHLSVLYITNVGYALVKWIEQMLKDAKSDIN